uniref:Glycoprotein nmb n=1 Tax=Amphilophus citrinellus TaxID=61819 RepID=A0A3Q0QWT9_AMPCI
MFWWECVYYILTFLAIFFLLPLCPAYRDVFPHKHSSRKFPFPIPPIPGWDPDSNPWDDYLYPPLNIKLNDFMSLTWKVYLSAGKPKVHLTSDSPALNGSCITFTAKLEYPPCQKEDASGDLIWDEHSANGQVHSGYVYNWTSWLDDYGFGKCRDKTKCNVFPDGKPFPQRNDWRRKSYVYVWHTMGEIQTIKVVSYQTFFFFPPLSQ